MVAILQNLSNLHKNQGFSTGDTPDFLVKNREVKENIRLLLHF